MTSAFMQWRPFGSSPPSQYPGDVGGLSSEVCAEGGRAGVGRATHPPVAASDGPREGRRMVRPQGIPGESGLGQPIPPVGDEIPDRIQIEVLVRRRVFLEICPGEIEEGHGRAKAVLLEMDERRGELDEAFVKRPVGAEPVFEPKVFEHLVRFEITTAVEALEESEVTGIEFSTFRVGDGGIGSAGLR